MHRERGAGLQWNDLTLDVLPGTVETLNLLESAGHQIILLTGRPEHFRTMLQDLLRYRNVPYHQLVMGATGGERVLVNDQHGNERRCQSVSVQTNSGISALRDII